LGSSTYLPPLAGAGFPGAAFASSAGASSFKEILI